MTTPASGQISLGDLKSELSLVGGPSYDISLANMAAYVMADGFYDTYGFTGQTGYGTGQVLLSKFYDLQSDASFVLYVQSNVTDYDQFQAILTNQSQATGTPGPNQQPNQFRNPATGTVSPGYNNGVNMTHMNQLDVTVNCNNTAGPPFGGQLNIEYNDGSGYAAFPGSPFQGPIINVNSTTVSNSPNNIGTPTFYVQCYM